MTPREAMECKAEIKGVAIKHGDLVIALPKPNRHHNVISYAVQELGITPPVGCQTEDAQGFYLEDGTFFNRYQAWRHVVRCGFKKEKELMKQLHLFSEDLW